MYWIYYISRINQNATLHYMLRYKKRNKKERNMFRSSLEALIAPFITQNIYSNYFIKFITIPPNSAITGPNTSETTVISLINMFIEGPEVSLNGSPTVSPTTAAL